MSNSEPVARADDERLSIWTLQEGMALCTAIQNLPSQSFHCHPALTGGLLYKQGPRKD